MEGEASNSCHPSAEVADSRADAYQGKKDRNLEVGSVEEEAGNPVLLWGEAVDLMAGAVQRQRD